VNITSSDLVVAAVGSTAIALSPDVGTYVLIAVGALIGVMHAVAKIDFATRPGWGGPGIKAAFYLLTWVGTALILTTFASALITRYTGFPADKWPGVVAFGITFLADKWPGWASAIMDMFVARFIRNGNPGEPK